MLIKDVDMVEEIKKMENEIDKNYITVDDIEEFKTKIEALFYDIKGDITSLYVVDYTIDEINQVKEMMETFFNFLSVNFKSLKKINRLKTKFRNMKEYNNIISLLKAFQITIKTHSITFNDAMSSGKYITLDKKELILKINKIN